MRKWTTLALIAILALVPILALACQPKPVALVPGASAYFSNINLSGSFNYSPDNVTWYRLTLPSRKSFILNTPSSNAQIATGVAIMTNGAVTVTHGLAGTPTAVGFSWMESAGGAYVLYGSTIGATTFVINTTTNVSGSKNVGWWATY